MKFLNFLFFLLILSLLPGQLTRIELSFFPIAFYLHDLILFILIISSVIYFFAIRKKFVLPKGAIFVLFFSIFALISLANSSRFFSLPQILVGSLFWVRFLAFFSLYPIFYNVLTKKQLNIWSNFLIITGAILAILGFLQMFFFYDLTFLQDYGYDPHIGRLVSTFLDPNFFGGFQVIILNLALASYLQKKEKLSLFSIPILFISIILTFSRSSYLALFVSIVLFGILRSRKLAVFALAIFILLTPLIPRIFQRILGALTLDITASARIYSWFQALQILTISPIIGVGFNNLRFTKANLGFFEISQSLGGHSGAGIDSSFLLVLSTVGILGILTFLTFYFYFIYKNFLLRKNFLALSTFISLISIFIHSQFVNSIFFPWIAVLLWIKIALTDVATNT